MEAPTRQSVGRGDSNASTTNDVNQRRTVIGQGQRVQGRLLPLADDPPFYHRAESDIRDLFCGTSLQ